jgi:hypothetical protein
MPAFEYFVRVGGGYTMLVAFKLCTVEASDGPVSSK